MNAQIARLAVGATFVISAVASSAFAFNEPDGFRGLPWGSTEGQMRKGMSTAVCKDYPRPDRWEGDRFCVVELKIGDIPIDTLYAFRGNKFVRVTMEFPSRDFDRLVAIFQERYGVPTNKRPNFAEWVGARVNISMDRYLHREDVSPMPRTWGSATLVTTTEKQESKRLADEQTKDLR
jgi:hypothetical protein